MRSVTVSVFCCALVVTVLGLVEPEQDLSAALRNMEIIGANIGDEKFDYHPPTEQQRVNTIKSALDKLPSTELTRLGIEIDGHFEAGTDRANKLIEAWNQRQQELKEALAGMLKPVEYMQDIANILQNTSLDDPSILQNIVALESLLADVDNARDFHTIGGWNVMNKIFSSPDTPMPVKSAIALCVGTAVKNSYDYQLWTLEAPTLSPTDASVSNLSSLLVALIHALESELQWISSKMAVLPDSSTPVSLGMPGIEHFRFVNNLMYGIYSSTRGNMDVQEAIQHSVGNVFVSTIRSTADLLIVPVTSEGTINQGASERWRTEMDSLGTAIMRKIWNFASDMIDEWVLIHGPSGLISGEQGEEVRDAALRLHPLGSLFVRETWWASKSSDIVWNLATQCLHGVDTSSDRTVASVPSSPLQGPEFNEDCLALSSSAHRSLYRAALHVRKQLRTHATFSGIDVESASLDDKVRDDSIELSCKLLNMHPLLSDWSEEEIVNQVVDGES